MPKVSVIVPVFNVERYLKKCLDSIVNQTFSDYEVIMVNDGSTDSSCEIAMKYVESNPSKFKLITQKNAGLGAARNTGIENANGDFYLFLDSDDTITSNAINHLFNTATQYNADIVVFDYKLINEDGKELGINSGCKNVSGVTSLETNPSLLLNHPSACNKFFKCTIFKDTSIRFPTKVWYEDLRTIPKLYIEAEVIVYSNIPLYNYLQRENSIMHSSDINRNAEIIEALDDVLNYYKINNLFDIYKEELEFLAVFHILLMGSVRVNKLKYNHPLMGEFYNYILKEFPNYEENRYVKELTKKERFILSILSKKGYRLLNFFLKLKKIIN